MISNENSIAHRVIQIKNGIMIHVNASVKKDHSWNRNTCISENDEYLESIPTDMTNNISTNVVRSMSINSDDKKVRDKIDYYILHRILFSDNINIHNRNYLVSSYKKYAKLKTYRRTNNRKKRIKKVSIKYRNCNYFNDNKSWRFWFC